MIQLHSLSYFFIHINKTLMRVIKLIKSIILLAVHRISQLTED